MATIQMWSNTEARAISDLQAVMDAYALVGDIATERSHGAVRAYAGVSDASVANRVIIMLPGSAERLFAKQYYANAPAGESKDIT